MNSVCVCVGGGGEGGLIRERKLIRAFMVLLRFYICVFLLPCHTKKAKRSKEFKMYNLRVLFLRNCCESGAQELGYQYLFSF